MTQIISLAKRKDMTRQLLSRLAHQRMSLGDAYTLLRRCVDAQARVYQAAQGAGKHDCLLALRRQYQLMQRELPGEWCEAMAQIWDVWWDIFALEEEEEREEADGAA
jgi:hypothetical protein